VLRSGEALLPAAQITLADETHSFPTITPFWRTALTGLFSLTVTPICSRAERVLSDSLGSNPVRLRGPASTRMIERSSRRKCG